MTSQDIRQEIQRIEREVVSLKADLFDRLHALEHLRGVHEAAKAQEDQASGAAR